MTNLIQHILTNQEIGASGQEKQAEISGLTKL